jgi:integrase
MTTLVIASKIARSSLSASGLRVANGVRRSGVDLGLGKTNSASTVTAPVMTPQPWACMVMRATRATRLGHGQSAWLLSTRMPRRTCFLLPWRVHVKPRWGKVSVADVDALGVEAWIAAMSARGAGATTVLRAHGVLSGILAGAVKGKRLAANPAKGIEGLPRKTAKRHVYLSAQDVARLADESGEHRALVLVLAFTGLRWGEAIALRVRDVAFLGRRLSVSENAVQIGARHAVGPTKGRKARSVPVPTFVLDELSMQCTGKAHRDLVFGGRNGGNLPRPKSSNGWFRRAVKAAGTQTVTPHDLRHTCASLAVSAGVNVLALQRMLGHQSAKVTLDTYADLFDDDLDAVSATLHARYSPENVGKMWAQGGQEAPQQTSKSCPPGKRQSEHRCGRRDSNPHALSSTGT